MLSKFWMDILDSLKAMGFSPIYVAISVIFSSFFIITFDWNGNFEFWLLHRKDLAQISQNITYYIQKIYIFHLEKLIFRWKINFFRFFFLQLSFKIPMIALGKTLTNLSEYTIFLFWKVWCRSRKKTVFSDEKMKNLGNCNYD